MLSFYPTKLRRKPGSSPSLFSYPRLLLRSRLNIALFTLLLPRRTDSLPLLRKVCEDLKRFLFHCLDKCVHGSMDRPPFFPHSVLAPETVRPLLHASSKDISFFPFLFSPLPSHFLMLCVLWDQSSQTWVPNPPPSFFPVSAAKFAPPSIFKLEQDPAFSSYALKFPIPLYPG